MYVRKASKSDEQAIVDLIGECTLVSSSPVGGCAALSFVRCVGRMAGRDSITLHKRFGQYSIPHLM
jgi:hypothetical protein